MGSAETRIILPGLGPIGVRRRRALSALADRQFGVVSRRELRRLGYSDSSVDALVADGTLHRKTHGVYAVGHPHLTREGWWSVAVRAGHDGTLLSHRASTAVRGLLRPVDVTDVIVPKSGGVTLPFVRAHQATVPDEDRDEVHGLPVTALGRTFVDLAAEHPARLVEALEQAIILEVYDHAEMLDAIDRQGGDEGSPASEPRSRYCRTTSPASGRGPSARHAT